MNNEGIDNRLGTIYFQVYNERQLRLSRVIIIEFPVLLVIRWPICVTIQGIK